MDASMRQLDECTPVVGWFKTAGGSVAASAAASEPSGGSWRVISFTALRTPLDSPQSNGMAEAFVRTLKRDYVRVSPVPDAETVLRQLPSWLAHYNQVHPPPRVGLPFAPRVHRPINPRGPVRELRGNNRGRLLRHLQELVRERDPDCAPAGHAAVREYVARQLGEHGAVTVHEFEYFG